MLVLRLTQRARIPVGRFGPLDFPPGWYLYVGSAFGPGGVRARCAHHLRISPRPRWHIDYLRARCELLEIWFSHHPRHLEHQWAGWLSGMRGVEQPVAGFGASDCGCFSHLFRFCAMPDRREFVRLAMTQVNDSGGINCKVI